VSGANSRGGRLFATTTKKEDAARPQNIALPNPEDDMVGNQNLAESTTLFIPLKPKRRFRLSLRAPSDSERSELLSSVISSGSRRHKWTRSGRFVVHWGDFESKGTPGSGIALYAIKPINMIDIWPGFFLKLRAKVFGQTRSIGVGMNTLSKQGGVFLKLCW